MKLIRRFLSDILFTFDWPVDVLGDKQSTIEMLKKVPFIFQNGALFNDLGSEMYKTLLDHLMPRMWFAGKVRHSLDKLYRRPSCDRETHFYSLNQYQPKRKRVAVIEVQAPNENGLEYDPEWLAILKATDSLVSIEREPNYELPELATPIKESLDEERELVQAAFKDNLKVPKNFTFDLPMKSVAKITFKDTDPKRERNYVNKQTKAFCSLLNITDPNQLLLDSIGQEKTRSFKSTCLKGASHLANSLCAKLRKTKKVDP